MSEIEILREIKKLRSEVNALKTMQALSVSGGILSIGGINVGTATGATSGQIIASDAIYGYSSYPVGMYYIDSKTAGAGGVASFDFQNIPQTFSHLWLMHNLRSTKAVVTSDTLNVRVNNLALANYYQQRVSGTAAVASAAESIGGSLWTWGVAPAAGSTASAFMDGFVKFGYYSQSNKLPSFIEYQVDTTTLAAGGLTARALGGYYNVAQAISRITLFFTADNIAQYSIASLYGTY